MSALTDITVHELEVFNQEIKDDMVSKRINASGKASNSLRVEVDEQAKSYQSIGVDYLEFVDRGRGANKDQSKIGVHNWASYYGENVLKPWAQSKGLNFDNYYLLAKSIAEKGTRILRDHSKGIEIDPKIEDLTRRIKEKVPKGLKADILKQLNKYKLQREI